MITLTDTAASKVGELLSSEAGDPVEDTAMALRVSVRPGGCSGYSYEMYFDSKISDNDKKLTFGEVIVVMDESSASLLEGATLDYKDGLEAGFSINNPNAERTCGCGQSFC